MSKAPLTKSQLAVMSAKIALRAGSHPCKTWRIAPNCIQLKRYTFGQTQAVMDDQYELLFHRYALGKVLGFPSAGEVVLTFDRHGPCWEVAVVVKDAPKLPKPELEKIAALLTEFGYHRERAR